MKKQTEKEEERIKNGCWLEAAKGGLKNSRGGYINESKKQTY